MAAANPTGTTMDAPTQEKPTILIVQGSFQTPLVYEKLGKTLESLGYPTIHPPLPTCNNTDSPDFPKLTLVDDALAVRLELTRLIEHEGKPVMVVMHSYGGLVGSEAIPAELSHASRHAKNLPGGVIHLLYVAAFLLEEGQSVLSALGESPNNDVKPDGRFYLRNGERALYNDLPAPEAALWASRLVAQSYKVQTTKLTRAAWRYIPSTYLVCENDQACPPQYQEMFAANAKAQVERCSAGHSPMLSQTDMLVGKIVGVLKKDFAGEGHSGESL